MRQTVSIFISYKSQDANHARSIAESLIKMKIRVWMAEYQVLPHNHEQFFNDDPEKVKQNLEAAVKKCSHGIAITNNFWTRSEFCSHEMQSMLKYLQVKNIIEVCCPQEELPRKTYPTLATNDPLIFEKNPDEIVIQILNRFGIRGSITSSHKFSLKGTRKVFERFGIDIQTGPFEIAPNATYKLLSKKYQTGQTAIYDSRIYDHQVQMHLRVSPFDTVLHELSISEQSEENDRRVYENYITYAKPWEKSIGITIKGLHLVFINGRSHMGLTYISKDDQENNATWERQYVITLYQENPEERGELHLTFLSRLEGTYSEQMAEFLSMTSLFDEIAQTVRYASPSPKKLKKNIGPIFLAKLTWLCTVVVFACQMFQKGSQNELFFLMMLISGLLSSDMLAVILLKPYKKIISLQIPLIEDTQSSAYSRFSTELLIWLGGNPFWLADHLILDLAAVIGRIGNIWFPGPVIIWMVVVWSGTAYARVYFEDLFAGAIFNFVCGFACGILFIARYVALETKIRYWQQMKWN